MFRKFAQFITLFIIVLLGLNVVAPVSATTFPGTNGRITFLKSNGYNTIKADGTDQQQLPQVNGVQNPAWSPDGSRIVYQAWNTRSVYSIWVMNSDGSNVREIPNTDKGQYPMWNPDGLSVLFSEPQATQDYPQLSRINIDGSKKTILYYYTYGDLSPDGNSIVTSVADMYPRVAISRGVQLPVGHPGKSGEVLYSEDISGHDIGCTLWNPAGTKVLLTRSDTYGQTELLIVNAGTKAVERTIFTTHLGIHSFAGGCPIWSPDGNSIAFNAFKNEIDRIEPPYDGSIYTFNLNTNTTKKVADDIVRIVNWQSVSNPMLYRLANWRTHERLFTTSPYEVLSAQKNDSGWIYEGVSSKVYNSGDSNRVPVYRLANWITHERLFTTDQAEANHATQNLRGWVYEGIAFYASTNISDTAMYRMANWKTHERLFTTDLDEVNHAVSNYEGWVYEGKAFYVPVQ